MLKTVYGESAMSKSNVPERAQKMWTTMKDQVLL
jgi:hypothetical protein